MLLMCVCVCVSQGYCYSEQVPSHTHTHTKHSRHPPATFRGMQMLQHVGRFTFQSERNTQPLSLCVGRVLPAQAGWLQCAALVGNANARDDKV